MFKLVSFVVLLCALLAYGDDKPKKLTGFEFAVTNERGETVCWGEGKCELFFQSYTVAFDTLQQWVVDGKVKEDIPVTVWIRWGSKAYPKAARTGNRARQSNGCGAVTMQGEANGNSKEGIVVHVENSSSSNGGNASSGSSSQSNASGTASSNANSKSDARAVNRNTNTNTNNNTNTAKCEPIVPPKPDCKPKDKKCKPKDGKGNNGVGNGQDGQPPGNPKPNDGPGTGKGNPGNKGGK